MSERSKARSAIMSSIFDLEAAIADLDYAIFQLQGDPVNEARIVRTRLDLEIAAIKRRIAALNRLRALI